MPAITVTTPGVSLPGFTAAAVAATQDFTLSGRTVALVGLIGSQPWAWSSDGTNFVNVRANVPWMLPVLTGQDSTTTFTFKRTTAVDAVMQVFVAG